MTALEIAGIGHNSRLAELEAERNRWRERALKAEAERDFANTKLGRISRIYGRDDISSRAKSIATAIIVCADAAGQVQFSTAQMARAASLTDRKAVVGAIDELANIRMVTADRPAGGRKPTLFSLLPEEILTEAIEAYRESKDAEATEGKTNSSQLRGKRTVAPSTEGKSLSSDVQLRDFPSVAHATEGKTDSSRNPIAKRANGHVPTEGISLSAGATEGITTGLDEQLQVCDKGVFPLASPFPPPDPPLTPYNPPFPKSTRSLETEESKDRFGAAVAKDATARPKLGKRLPDDWQLSDELRAWTVAEYPTVPAARITQEAEGFRDYWHAEASQKARKLNWDLTWKTWARRSFGRLLIEQARANGRPSPLARREQPWWADPGKVGQITDTQWRGSIDKHAGPKWPIDKLGPPPGHPDCVVPRALVAELKLTDRYTEFGHERRNP